MSFSLRSEDVKMLALKVPKGTREEIAKAKADVFDMLIKEGFIRPLHDSDKASPDTYYRVFMAKIGSVQPVAVAA